MYVYTNSQKGSLISYLSGQRGICIYVGIRRNCRANYGATIMPYKHIKTGYAGYAALYAAGVANPGAIKLLALEVYH